MKPWLSYSLIRLGLFAVTLTALLLLGVPGWLSAIVSALIGLSVAYIFFRPQRDAVAESIAARRERGEVNSDADEDTALDRDQ